MCLCICMCLKPFSPMRVPPQHRSENSKHSWRRNYWALGALTSPLIAHGGLNGQDEAEQQNTVHTCTLQNKDGTPRAMCSAHKHVLWIIQVFLFFLKKTLCCALDTWRTKEQKGICCSKKTGVAAHVWITKRHGLIVQHTQKAQSGTQVQVMFRFMSGTGDGCVKGPEDKGG